MLQARRKHHWKALTEAKRMMVETLKLNHGIKRPWVKCDHKGEISKINWPKLNRRIKL